MLLYLSVAAFVLLLVFLIIGHVELARTPAKARVSTATVRTAASPVAAQSCQSSAPQRAARTDTYRTNGGHPSAATQRTRQPARRKSENRSETPSATPVFQGGFVPEPPAYMNEDRGFSEICEDDFSMDPMMTGYDEDI